MIAIQVDTGQLPNQLTRLEEALRRRWWQMYAPSAQMIIEREQRRHFREQRSPDGDPWRPLSARTLAISREQARRKVEFGQQKSARIRRTRQSRILIDTGLLMRSVTTGGSGAVRQIGESALVVGTRVEYAAIHQFGAMIEGVKIPARPFLGMSERGKQELAKAARWQMEKLLRSL